jgi:hypothetical protein
MAATRKTTPYRSDWAYPLARVPGFLLMFVGWVFGLPTGLVFAVAWLVAVALAVWCFRDWALDRLLEWLNIEASFRSLEMFGEPALTRTGAREWLEEHPDRADLATFEALLIADRRDDALRLFDKLPGSALPLMRYYRARVDASEKIDEGAQPDLDGLRNLADQIEELDDRRYAHASLVQLEMVMASYGDLPIDEVRRDAWRTGREIRLPRRKEIGLLFSVFAGVAIVLATFALILLSGGL